MTKNSNKRKRSTGRVLTNEFLLDFSAEHLAYEFEMFFATAAEQMIPKGATHSGNVKNALLESFTIHARSILFFFYPSNEKSDDVLARHYLVDGKNWEALRPALSTSLSTLQRRVGKEIAHLTYVRAEVSVGQKLWEYSPVLADALAVIRVFFENSDPLKLHTNSLITVNFWIDVFLRNKVLKTVPEKLG